MWLLPDAMDTLTLLDPLSLSCGRTQYIVDALGGSFPVSLHRSLCAGRLTRFLTPGMGHAASSHPPPQVRRLRICHWSLASLVVPSMWLRGCSSRTFVSTCPKAGLPSLPRFLTLPLPTPCPLPLYSCALPLILAVSRLLPYFPPIAATPHSPPVEGSKG